MTTKKFSTGDYIFIYESCYGEVETSKVVNVSSLSELNEELTIFIEDNDLKDESEDTIIVRKLGAFLTVKKEGFTVCDL